MAKKKRQIDEDEAGRDPLGKLLLSHHVSIIGVLLVAGVVVLIGLGIITFALLREPISLLFLAIGAGVLLLAMVFVGMNVINVGRRLELRKRGVRILIGGDYGFAQTPQGDNARDLKHFVGLLGFSPNEALQCGTRIGGQVMGLGDELGQIKEGYLADLLLVDGDPLKDLDLVVHEKNLHVIMKEGSLYKDISAAKIIEHTVAAD